MFGHGDVSNNAILVNLVDHDLARDSEPLLVELNRLIGVLVFLFDSQVIREQVNCVLLPLDVGLLELQGNPTAVFLWFIALAEVKFDIIAVSTQLELREFIPVAGDQAALYAEISKCTLQMPSRAQVGSESLG